MAQHVSLIANVEDPALIATVAATAVQTSAALTDNSAGTANTTVQALADGSTYATDVAAIRNNFADLVAMVNKLTADVAALYAARALDRTAINAVVGASGALAVKGITAAS